MDIFLKISEIGQSQIIPFFESLLDFFKKPLYEILPEFRIGFIDITKEILNFFGVSSSPLWLFLLQNIGLILSLHLIALVLKALPIV